jgi:predicted acetyltransferase
VHNSEAPRADEVKVGNEVVVFYKWSDNMGGDLAANALYASHGGIYQVATSRKGEIALGKGDGYAIAANVAVSDLKSQISALLK